jgi:hypothetical protein
VDAGARHYVATLAHQFPASFEAARAGDTARFAGNLAKEGYFTASEASYRVAIERNVWEFAHGPTAARSDSTGLLRELRERFALWFFRTLLDRD